MSIAVVLPAYNEAATVADIVRRALRQIPWVIVVDDGSTDATAERLEALPITVLRHAANRGKAASLATGIRFALDRGAEAVITLDADGQHRPEDIPELRAAAERHPDKLVIAARLHGREGVPRARRFANGMADFWISWAAGHPIRDSQSGFRLYPAALLRRIDLRRGERSGFVFESEILIEAARLGYHTSAVAVDSLYPQSARASYYRPAADTARIVRMVAWKLISRGLYLPGLYRYLRLLSGTAPRREPRNLAGSDRR